MRASISAFFFGIKIHLPLPRRSLFLIFVNHYRSRLPINGGEINHRRLVELLSRRRRPTFHSLEEIQSFHGISITTGSNLSQPIYLSNLILAGYVSTNDILVARNVFDEMSQRNIVSYNTMIAGYSRNGDPEQAWEIFCEMRFLGFNPNQFTFGGILSCGALDLHRGMFLHALIVKNGLIHVDPFAGTALLNMFGNHGCIDEAINVFDELPQKSSVTYNSMISLFKHNGYVQDSIFMFKELMRSESNLSECSFVNILSGLLVVDDQTLEFGQQIHGLIVKNGFDFASSVSNSLMNMYAKNSNTSMVEKMFEHFRFKDTTTWNTVIGALTKSDRPEKALGLYSKMHFNGVLPNHSTLSAIINCCCNFENQIFGEYFHAKSIKNDFQKNVFVGSSLVDFYSKFNKLDEAHRCFDEILEKNLVSWNALMMGYSNLKGQSSSIFIFREMIRLGFCPNEYSFSIVFKSSSIFELEESHSLVIKMGYQEHKYVFGSLLTSYAKNNLVSSATALVVSTGTPLSTVLTNIIAGVYNKAGEFHKTQELFSELEDPDSISWNILIAACAKNGDFQEVFDLFRQMRLGGTDSDKYTFVSLFTVCGKLCNLALGSSLHGLVIKMNPDIHDTFVFNVMIDMYGKCGNLEGSTRIFNELKGKNVISWTTLISGLGLNGYGRRAVEVFEKMVAEGFRPDGVAFLAVLSACRHVGLVNEGLRLFREMKLGFGVEPGLDHYRIAVDLLARNGRLKEAERLIRSMSVPPDVLIWRSFLDGCKKERNYWTGKQGTTP